MKSFILIGVALTFCAISRAQTTGNAPQPAVVTAQMKNGQVEYRLDGRIVENSTRNSLITNLGNVLVTRGKDTAVFVVVDVRAPFAEFSHIDTALDKVDLPTRRYFVSNFTKDQMILEIHWDDKAIPIPRHVANQ